MTESASSPAKKEMRLEREVTIDAPVEVVWKALTDADRLKNWFPLDARVTPGKGGKIFLSWGPDCEGEAEIIAWEPNKKFASKEQLAVIEWSLESREGKTILRLVQCGFSTGADWENEWFESTSFGWSFMLLNLRWLLEKHAGQTRFVAWPRHTTGFSRADTYHRLLAAGALFREGAAQLRDGQPFALTTSTGAHWTGSVHFTSENRGFCLSVNELNNALLLLTIEGAPDKIEAQLWLSAYDVPESQVKRFESEWKTRLHEIFSN